MTFAEIGGGVMQESKGMPTSPQKQTHIFRWITALPSWNNIQVTALNPGSEKLGLKVSRQQDGCFAVEVSGSGGSRRTIRVTRKLELKK